MLNKTFQTNKVPLESILKTSLSTRYNINYIDQIDVRKTTVLIYCDNAKNARNLEAKLEQEEINITKNLTGKTVEIPIDSKQTFLDTVLIERSNPAPR